MPAIQAEVALLTATSNSNIFAGSAFEIARGRTLLSLGLTQSATGLKATVQSGSDVILEEADPFVLGTLPIVPDHMFYNDIMEPMDRLRVGVRNPTGGTLTIRGLALLTAL